MSLSAIEAKFSCDFCNQAFTVDLDSAASGNLFDHAIDACANGILGHSVEGGMHLCGKCTKELAAKSPTDEALSAEEVVDLLGGPL